MPALLTQTQKQMKPTVDSAFSGFQNLIEHVKQQQTSWTHYLNIQGQNGEFDLVRMLQYAFFMQAVTNKKAVIDYKDSVEVRFDKVASAIAKNNGVLLYESSDSCNVEKQMLYTFGSDTVVFIEKRNQDWTNVRVLTFERSILDGSPPGSNSIKQTLSSLKEKDVEMETCTQ